MFNDFLTKIKQNLNLGSDSASDPYSNHPPSLSKNLHPSSFPSATFSDSFANSEQPLSSEKPTFSDFSEMAPQTLGEFIELIKNTPKSVLSAKDRRRIAAVMSFDEKHVRDLMVPRHKMIFIHKTDTLGPLVLDKLYKSGSNIFPVVDKNDHVLGVIHTEALNNLEIRETSRAEKYLDPEVNYLHSSDSLKTAIDEIERTNNYYFLVLDELDTLAGFFSVQQLFDYLLK